MQHSTQHETPVTYQATVKLVRYRKMQTQMEKKMTCLPSLPVLTVEIDFPQSSVKAHKQELISISRVVINHTV